MLFSITHHRFFCFLVTATTPRMCGALLIALCDLIPLSSKKDDLPDDAANVGSPHRFCPQRIHPVP